MNAPRIRVVRRPVHGVLLLDKPLGLSSNDALQKAKWLLRAEKAGHTGTLDPLATGVLPLCFGAATKFSQLQLDADKSYEATAVLGSKTSTGDAEGQVISRRPVDVTAAQLAQVCQQFTGPIAQIPPMYSALKKEGKALYAYARAGVEVAREPRFVTIYELYLALAKVNTADDAITMVVKCSKGTYIRTLGEDIGETLGCGAHLSALRRTATGHFTQAQCVTLAQLEAMSESERLAQLLPVDALLPQHLRVTLDADNAGRFLSGLRRRGTWPNYPQVAVYGPANATTASHNQTTLLGTAHTTAGELIPERLLSPLEIQQILESRNLEPSPSHALNMAHSILETSP
ncbi:MAG: tRNA pseudouridine(55) synthase TruB [Burkholderiaceae bacterium]